MKKWVELKSILAAKKLNGNARLVKAENVSTLPSLPDKDE
jgi:hypothetical protein